MINPSSSSTPAREWIADTSSASATSRSGSRLGSRSASIVLPDPRRAVEVQVVPPGGGDLERPLRLRLTGHIGEIERSRTVAGPTRLSPASGSASIGDRLVPQQGEQLAQ